MTKEFKKGDFVIYSKSVNSILCEQYLVEIIDYKYPYFTIEIQESKKVLEKITSKEFEEIWTNNKQLEKIGFINYGNYYQLKEIVIFIPKYNLEILDEDVTNTYIEVKKKIFGNQIFVANQEINEKYFDLYKEKNLLNVENFYEKHTEVTLLLNLFEFLDLKEIKYNRKEISMLSNFNHYKS